MEISATFHLQGEGDNGAIGEEIAAHVKQSIEDRYGPDASGRLIAPAVAGLSVRHVEIERSRFELTLFTYDLKTNNDVDLADRLVEVAVQVREGVHRGVVAGEHGKVGRFDLIYRDDLDAEPAYTVIAVYLDGDDFHQRYATTVYTHNGPEAAEQLAQQACREDNDHDTGEDLLEIAAVIRGEVAVVG
jgi:hypothetical protein